MAKMFGGKETKGEEKAEARAVKSGKISPAEYARREKAEGDKQSPAALKAKGAAMKSGKLSPEQYAAGMANGGKAKKYANGGMVRKYADGGSVRSSMKHGPGGAC